MHESNVRCSRKHMQPGNYIEWHRRSGNKGTRPNVVVSPSVMNLFKNAYRSKLANRDRDVLRLSLAATLGTKSFHTLPEEVFL